jgi:CRP-like cAMP-binding protein
MTPTGIRDRARGARLAALRELPIFSGLSDAALRRVDAQMMELDVAADTVLVRQGEHGREALIVATGRAAVYVDGEVVSSVRQGEMIGEMSLLDNGRRTATVVALTPMRVYVLDARQFASLFDEPQTGRWIAATLAKRLRARTGAAPAA